MLHYHLSFSQYYQHLIQLNVRFEASVQQQLWLPTWIPGSYLIREFARHIESVRAVNSATGESIAVRKLSKNTWQLDNQQDQLAVEVSYQVYAYDLSVRGAYVDHERLYVNPAAVCLAIAGQEACQVSLHIEVPESLQHFQLSGSYVHGQVLPAQPAYQFKLQDYATLIDSPFELSEQQQVQFKVNGIPHQLAISGLHQANLSRLSQDLQRICQTEIAMFGEAPFRDYSFMVMATGNSYGGLEHQSSTSLISPRDDLPKWNEPAQPSSNYQRFLGLCSHEYFHAWLVKFIRPHNFVYPDLHQEAYTSLLWIFEGFTSYYDDLILYRSGVIDQAAYLGLLGEQVSRYLQNPGRAVQSVAESSFDAWIKYYRPDENSNNAGTSYYNKGALVALCLDLTLRQQGASLDDLLRCLYQRAKQGIPVDEQTIAEVSRELTGQAVTDFLDRYVYGTEELPLQALLADAGVLLSTDTKVWPLGIKVQETTQGLQVQQVLRHSAAAVAGLSAQDVIIAINQLKASNSLLLQTLELHKDKAQSIPLHVFRRDELKSFYLQGKAEAMPAASLKVQDPALLKRWL